MIGKTLSHYSIEKQIGVGGMGEVYQARDTRLGRLVAVKVLPEAFAQDAERVARFEREAKVLASLNHPNIAAIHGFEEDKGTYFLVMELVEGETLADRIARGKIGVDEAMNIAHQILDALDAAHDKGVVHRDLKPSNVKITPEGKAKVLDFGLAKAMETSPVNPTLSNSPTLSNMATGTGVILGTAAYMSPEQAKGQNTDARSDIFSFGAVLYEMLTGKQAFYGENVSEILARVIEREPDWSRLPANLNPRIVAMLRRCLQKNLKRRQQSVVDLRAEVEEIIGDPRGLIVGTETSVGRKPLRKRAIPVMMGIVITAVVVGVVAWNLKPSATPTAAIVTRFPFTLPDDQQFTNGDRQLLSISPDGTEIVYVANRRLYLKLMRESESIAIQGTETGGGVLNPVFSPDGQSIVFWSEGALKRIAISGGAPVTVCPADAPQGISWGTDDQIVFGQGTKSIMRVSANGGQPETIVTLKEGELAEGPQILPGGDTVLYTLYSVYHFISRPSMWSNAKIVVQSLKSGERKILIDGGSDAHYVPTGHIVYMLNGNLLAVPFDLKRLEVTGGPTPVVEGIRTSDNGLTGTAQFSFSSNGSLVYIPAEAGNPRYQLSFVDRNGGVMPIAGLPVAPYYSLRLSPDGQQLAFDIYGDANALDIWVYRLSGTNSMRRLTFGETNRAPIWSGDGQRIVFASNREGGDAIYSQRVDGTGTAERLTKPDPGMNLGEDSWLPGEEKFFFVTIKGAATDIWLYSVPDKKATPVVQIPSSAQLATSASADGHWLAYQSNETGRFEIYVQPFPTTGGKFQITRDGGDHPLWSPDGKELFYVNNGRLFSVAVRTQPTFEFGDATPLPISGFGQTTVSPRAYDITPDGKRFIMMFPPKATTEGQSSPPQIQVVLNWFSELKQRVGLN